VNRLKENRVGTFSQEDSPCLEGDWHRKAAALQFLTITYPFVRRSFTGREMGRSVGCFPLVGLLLGAVLAGLHFGLGVVFAGASVPLLLASWVVLTGAIHVDVSSILATVCSAARLRRNG